MNENDAIAERVMLVAFITGMALYIICVSVAAYLIFA